MDPTVVASLISGGSSLLGGTIGSVFNVASQGSTNAANERLARENRDFYYQQWLRENAYNDPSAQMARLQRAGLNPNLMYGEGAAGLPASATMQNVDAPRLSAPQVDPLTLAQIANINADTKKKTAEVDETKTKTDWYKGQIKVGESVVLYNGQLINFSKSQQKLVEGQTEMLATQTDEANSRIALNYASVQNMTIQQQQRWLDLSLRSKEVDSACSKMAAETGYTLEQTKYVAALAMAKVYNLRSEGALNEARKNLTNKQIEECDQAIANMKVQNGQMSWQLQMDQKYNETERELKIKQGATDIVTAIANASHFKAATVDIPNVDLYDELMGDVKHLSR